MPAPLAKGMHISSYYVCTSAVFTTAHSIHVFLCCFALSCTLRGCANLLAGLGFSS
jgi:hypothetical protein